MRLVLSTVLKKGITASTRASLTVGTASLFPSLLAFYMYWKKTFQACWVLSFEVISGSFIREIALTSDYWSLRSYSKASTTSFLMRSFSRYGLIATRHSTSEYRTLQLFLPESTSRICLKSFSVISSFLKARAIVAEHSRALILIISKVSAMREFQMS